MFNLKALRLTYFYNHLFLLDNVFLLYCYNFITSVFFETSLYLNFFMGVILIMSGRHRA